MLRVCAKTCHIPSPRQRTTENSPAIYRWEAKTPKRKSEKRTAETSGIKEEPSAVRFSDYEHFAPYPSSKLLGYCQSSAQAD